MRYLLTPILFVLATSIPGTFAQEKKAAPQKMVFAAKNGNVTFNHAAHVKRAKEDCKTCHPKLWPQAKGPLNYKVGVHKPAEAKKISCGACHNAAGPAFESKGNCAKKCHVKAAS
ncbi:MAG: hypothetical protein LLG20_07995 [Acidobacteriales bacterium]|nr:hypothetical protein [Terriglobales bacterium]